MKNVITDIYHLIHTVESRLNYVECKYGEYIREDDVKEVYKLLADLCHETNAVKDRMDGFLKLDRSTLKVIHELLINELTTESRNIVEQDFNRLIKIVEAAINFKK